LKNKTVENALKAMLYEVVVNPKPGLVDPTQHQSHGDMDVFTFIDSSLSLSDYFYEVYETGANFRDADLTELFKLLRPIGVQAEKTMFEATRGVNTHKGVIFSLGILVAAAAYSPDSIIETTKKMLVGLTKTDLLQVTEKTNLTAGERQFLEYGFTGVRGEAEAGFPIVTEIGLAFLRETRGDRNQRLLDTLLKISEFLPDSNLIKRSGDPEILTVYHKMVELYFSLGGSETELGRRQFERLRQKLAIHKLSLGGSADMLIITIFLALQEGLDF
jgi:triphosphoribosyl-dephospho-CoA synthase CitG